jgi:hypothetical protein
MTADPAARNATCHIDIAGDGSISGLTDDLDGQINQRILSVCPLTDVLLQIPLTDRLFVSGSCATWMAERVMFQCDPEWLPNDIDVFACLPLDDFENMVAQFMRLQRDADAISVVRKRHNRIVDVTLPCGITVSFIKCSASCRSQDVIEQFDIDVCRPIIIRRDGDMSVQMTVDVAASIWNRIMNVINRKRNVKFLQYPLQRSLQRARKYAARGYTFASLTFLSSSSIDFPELDAACSLNIDDFCVPQVVTFFNSAAVTTVE